MINKRAELSLPSHLDANPLPLVSEETHHHADTFFFTAQDAIGYSIDRIYLKGDILVSDQDPVFDAVWIDYARLSYIEHLSSAYLSSLQMDHRREASAILTVYRDLVLNKQAYIFLRMFVAGEGEILNNLFAYLEQLAKQNHAVRSTKKLRFTDDFNSIGKNITEPHILRATFIFS